MAETARMTALRNLSQQMPVASQRIAAGQQAARDIQIQQAVAKAPTAAPITATAQQTGAAVAQQAGQQQVAQAQQQVQQQGQVGQLGLAEQQRQSQAEIASAQMGARQEQMNQEQRFAKLDAKLKKELYDDQMKFQKDELGRTKFNETQLADYARANARSDEEYANFAQKAQQINKRKLQMMEHAHKLIEEDLAQKQKMAEKAKDQKSFLEIEAMKRAAREAMERQKAKAANKGAMFQTGGMIAGTIVGAYFGGPAGAAVGGQAGSAVGGMVGNQVG